MTEEFTSFFLQNVVPNYCMNKCLRKELLIFWRESRFLQIRCLETCGLLTTNILYLHSKVFKRLLNKIVIEHE